MIQPQRMVETVKKINMLLYGDGGAGKTRFCATAYHPEKKQVVIISFEGKRGLNSVVGRNFLHFAPESYKELNDIYQWILVEGKKNDIWAVALDSITELQSMAMDHILQSHGKMETAVSAVDFTKQVATTQKDWGENTDFIRRVVRRFLELPHHIILTARQREREDEGRLTSGPDITPSLASYIHAQVDIVGQIYPVDEKQQDGTVKPGRRINYVMDMRHKAKDRFSVLGSAEQPNFLVLYAKVFPKGKEAKQVETPVPQKQEVPVTQAQTEAPKPVEADKPETSKADDKQPETKQPETKQPEIAKEASK